MCFFSMHHSMDFLNFLGTSLSSIESHSELDRPYPHPSKAHGQPIVVAHSTQEAEQSTVSSRTARAI